LSEFSKNATFRGEEVGGGKEEGGGKEVVNLVNVTNFVFILEVNVWFVMVVI
jgi:hypothetical protein